MPLQPGSLTGAFVRFDTPAPTADVIEDRRAVACQMLNDEARAWLCEQPGEPSLSFDQRQDGRFAA